MWRVGFGYDVHRLVQGRTLVLGGVDIPFEKGLDGYSDADVLSHAIGDALLGAANLGDLGKHFPPGDERFKDISSLILLEKIRALIQEKNWQIANVDATIVAQRPKLAKFIDEMKHKLSQSLKIETDVISIKATTTEGLGFTGIEKGIAAYAVCLLKKFQR